MRLLYSVITYYETYNNVKTGCYCCSVLNGAHVEVISIGLQLMISVWLVDWLVYVKSPENNDNNK